MELPLAGGGSSGSSVSESSSGGSQGTSSSCVGGASVIQGGGAVGWSFGGSGNGDDDPYERPTDYKRLGGCITDEGLCSAVEEQPSDQSAKELVPGIDTNYMKAYKESKEAPATKRDASVSGPPQARALPQYLPFQALGIAKQQANPNPYEHSGNSYEGEELQGQCLVREDQCPLFPRFPQQVTSPNEGMQQARQMVGTPSRGRLVIPPIARNRWQAPTQTPEAEQETAQLLVFPPDEADWAAVEHHGQQHIPVVVESIDTAPLVGMLLTQATDLVAQQLMAAGFDPKDEFVLAMVVVLDNSTEYVPLGGNMTMPSLDEIGLVAAVHVDKVYHMSDMYKRRVGN